VGLRRHRLSRGPGDAQWRPRGLRPRDRGARTTTPRTRSSTRSCAPTTTSRSPPSVPPHRRPHRPYPSRAGSFAGSWTGSAIAEGTLHSMRAGAWWTEQQRTHVACVWPGSGVAALRGVAVLAWSDTSRQAQRRPCVARAAVRVQAVNATLSNVAQVPGLRTSRMRRNDARRAPGGRRRRSLG
jgi:hypothetical protein